MTHDRMNSSPEHAEGPEKRYFKGWAKPGPLIPRDSLSPAPSSQGEAVSLDAVSGDYRLHQLKRGHRFSTDDVILAWYASSWAPRVETILDLGSGLGTVATIVAWRLPFTRLVTIEAQETSIELARRSVKDNGLLDRMDLRFGDFRTPGILAPEERFDLVLASPPYWPPEEGLEGDHPQKVACRFELRGDVVDYCRVAATHLDWGGMLGMVFPVTPNSQMERVQQAAKEHGLHILRWRKVILKEGRDYALGLFCLHRLNHLSDQPPTWQEPDLIIRRADGTLHPEYQSIKPAFGFPPTP